MVFDLDVLQDEESKQPYEFRAGGQKWRLPHVHDLTLRQQVALDQGRIIQVVQDVAERYATPSGWVADGKGLSDVLLDMKGARVGKLQAAWLTQAGMEPGESGASSSS